MKKFWEIFLSISICVFVVCMALCVLYETKIILLGICVGAFGMAGLVLILMSREENR